MLQNREFQPTQVLEPVQPCATCANCPMFKAYEGDTRSRGTCTLFDRVTRSHWPQTQDCRNGLQEVVLHLYSEEQEQDPDFGHFEPVQEIQLSLFLSEITKQAVKKAFQTYQDMYQGFYLAYYHPCQQDAEF